MIIPQVNKTIHHWYNTFGLFYTDVSGCYASPGTVSEQLFSDFWFYGPLLPVPDLYLLKQLIATIRNAFVQADSPASYRHFGLLEHPRQPVSSLELGNEHARDNAESKRLFVDNGGQVHSVHLEGFAITSIISIS